MTCNLAHVSLLDISGLTGVGLNPVCTGVLQKGAFRVVSPSRLGLRHLCSTGKLSLARGVQVLVLCERLVLVMHDVLLLGVMSLQCVHSLGPK